jgi:hypothetical protein
LEEYTNKPCLSFGENNESNFILYLHSVGSAYEMVLAACEQLRRCHPALYALYQDRPFADFDLDSQELDPYGKDPARDEYAEGQIS